MPSTSRKQQKFMGMVHAAKKGEKPASPAVAKAAKGMSAKAAKDFASTKHKGLPEKKKKKIKEALEAITALTEMIAEAKSRTKDKTTNEGDDRFIIKSGPNKGKRWSPDTPGPTNKDYKEIDGGIPSPPDGATAPPPGWKPEKTPKAPRNSNKRAEVDVDDGEMTAESKKKNDGNLANNAKPYDKVTRGDVVAGRLGKDEMGGKKKTKKQVNEWSVELDGPPRTGSYPYQLYGKDRERYDAGAKGSGPESERVRQYYKNKKLDRDGELQKYRDEEDADYADRLNAVRAARIANNELTPGEWIKKGANAVRTTFGGEDRPLKPAKTVVDLDGPTTRSARYVGSDDFDRKKYLDPKVDAEYKERQKALFPELVKENLSKDELASRLFETSEDHYDHEASMAKAQLLRIAEQSVELFKMIQEGDNLEGWVAAKITKANDYINAVHQNMAYDEIDDQEQTISSNDDYIAELRKNLEQQIKS
jgi:hypothetical protein